MRGALIAAAYAALTLLLAPISYGSVQFRISEALTLLPFYFPEAVPGLTIGCVFANFFGGYGLTSVNYMGAVNAGKAYAHFTDANGNLTTTLQPITVGMVDTDRKSVV